MPAGGATVDDEEIRRFAAQADAWWDSESGFRALHRLNPPRLDFIRSRLLKHFQRDSPPVAAVHRTDLARHRVWRGPRG